MSVLGGVLLLAGSEKHVTAEEMTESAPTSSDGADSQGDGDPSSDLASSSANQ